jgi:hypothetical protein
MQSKFPAYGRAEQKLQMMHDARARGIDVACDTEAFPLSWVGFLTE